MIALLECFIVILESIDLIPTIKWQCVIPMQLLFQYLCNNMSEKVSGFNSVSKNLRGFQKPLETFLPMSLN